MKRLTEEDLVEFEEFGLGGAGDFRALLNEVRTLWGEKAQVWEEGWNACAWWWEINHHEVVRDDTNPYGEA